MSILSLLVSSDGLIESISLADLLSEHRIIAACIQTESGITVARHAEKGSIQVETPIGVRGFDLLSEDKTVAQFDLFHATNESRIVYPEQAIGKHEIDESSVELYIPEALRRLKEAVRQHVTRTNPLPVDRVMVDEMLFYEARLVKLMETLYIDERRYLKWTGVMVQRIFDAIADLPGHDAVLLIDEDANSTGNLTALTCWDKIRSLVRAVVIYDEDGFTAESKKTASRHPLRYITFFDAMFTGEEMQARAVIIDKYVRESGRNEAPHVIFASPINAVPERTRFPLPTIAGRVPLDYASSPAGATIGAHFGDSRAFQNKVMNKLLGTNNTDEAVYADRFISHPEMPARFLTGYMGLLHSDVDSNEYTESPPLVENYERDRDLMHFADSIDYRFFAWTSGEPRMRSVTGMSDVLFPRKRD